MHFSACHHHTVTEYNTCPTAPWTLQLCRWPKVVAHSAPIHRLPVTLLVGKYVCVRVYYDDLAPWFIIRKYTELTHPRHPPHHDVGGGSKGGSPCAGGRGVVTTMLGRKAHAADSSSLAASDRAHADTSSSITRPSSSCPECCEELYPGINEGRPANGKCRMSSVWL